jgi:poly-gamma-glutamate system protein
LNISVLAALQIIGARPVIVSSIGSSMWGANNPAFSWLDMEKLLFDKGIFRYKSVAVSLGGRTDRGGNVSPEGRQIMRDIIARNGVPLIEEQTLDEAIRERMKIFEENLKPGEKFAAYINVGGGLASLGSAQNLVMIESGLNLTLAPGNYPLKGTMILMGEKDVPMINLSDVDVLARRYGLPVAPEPIPDIPHGDIYFKEKYRLAVVIPTLIIYVIIVFIFIRIDVMANLFNKNRG